MTTTPEAAKIPEDVMQAAGVCYAECEQMDSYGIVETIARAIFAERERCALVAENYSGMAHAAFDMGSKSFPNKSPVPDFIAKKIRGEG